MGQKIFYQEQYNLQLYTQSTTVQISSNIVIEKAKILLFLAAITGYLFVIHKADIIEVFYFHYRNLPFFFDCHYISKNCSFFFIIFIFLNQQFAHLVPLQSHPSYTILSTSYNKFTSSYSLLL